MISSNGNIFCVTGHSPVNSPHKDQWRGALRYSLICARINGWVNKSEVGDLKRRCAYYDVTVMCLAYLIFRQKQKCHIKALFGERMLRQLSKMTNYHEDSDQNWVAMYKYNKLLSNRKQMRVSWINIPHYIETVHSIVWYHLSYFEPH